MNSPDQFIGGTFAWFTGVVEDVMDPLQMGRVRIRCFGYHTDNKSEIPTSDLPWASVMTPITSASMSGIGLSATGILQGSWVVGFFRDGPSAQDPIILGTVPSMNVSAPDISKGFSDPSGKYPLITTLMTPDMPIEARKDYKLSKAYHMREVNLPPSVPIAKPPTMTATGMDPEDIYLARQEWKPWSIQTVVKPSYPKNQVFKTESGHVFEVDDTPGAERILDYHRSGTYSEIDAKGNKTTTVMGTNYKIVLSNDDIYIYGNANLTVEGNLRHYVSGNYHLEVEGNKTEYIHGSRQSKILGLDHLDANKYLETLKTSMSALPGNVSNNGDTPGNSIASVTSSGFAVKHPEINLDGNVKCKNGATGVFTSTDGSTIQVVDGIVILITR